jgi:signal transduction histidine kinase/HD-like signal output (HDOD) protein
MDATHRDSSQPATATNRTPQGSAYRNPVEQRMTTQRRPADRFPSLPQVLVCILDAIRADDYRRLTEAIGQDAVIASRLIAIANTAQRSRTAPCQTVERALLVLGVDTVKTIVITAAIREFFSSYGRRHQGFLKAFWQRSLLSAHFAHILANLTGYRAPDQAYLGGLLTDLGQLVLLTTHDQQYLQCWHGATNDLELVAAERAQFGADHCDVGADLIDRWHLDPSMVDALRYHHDDAHLVLDAHHLVKIINLASLLGAPGVAAHQPAMQAGLLFGLSEELTEELRRRVHADVEKLARTLDIDTTDAEETQDTERAHQQLGQRLAELSELGQVSAELWRAPTRRALEQAVQRTIYLTLGVERCLLFATDADDQHLEAEIADGGPRPTPLRIPLLPNRSIVVDAFLQNRMLDSGERSTLPVVDRQVLRFCQSERLLCAPLVGAERTVGVLVLGLNAQMPPRSPLLSALCREIGNALVQVESPTDALRSAADDLLQQRVREAVHEASNPLSIIGNYLEMLRLKLAEEHQVRDDIEAIKQEIDRVGNILLRLREPSEIGNEDGLDLNRLIQQLANVFQRSVFAARRLQLELRLDEQAPVVRAPAASIKQIVINLVKNAAEALDEGGTVVVTTSSNVNVAGSRFAALTVEDNGPGIPAKLLNQLFSPVPSSKGSGLGLTIAKRLVDEMGGMILCKSGAWGTQFQVLIPL